MDFTRQDNKPAPAADAAALAALRAFGPDLSRSTAAALLACWAGRRTLSAAERRAVLSQFKGL